MKRTMNGYLLHRCVGVSAALIGATLIGLAGQVGAAADAPASCATSAATTAPVGTSAPASQPSDPAAVELLRRLEQAQGEYPTLRADLEYTIYFSATGEKEKRSGNVVFRRGDDKRPSAFRIQFDSTQLDQERAIQEKVVYAYDGQWFTTQKFNVKYMRRDQYGAPGEGVNPFRIGQGPFPLPLGQKTQDMLDHFIASTRPPTKDDPADTDYLELLPQASKTEILRFTKAQIWIDRKTHLPVKLTSLEKNKDFKLVLFKDIKPGVNLDNEQFLPPNPPRDWDFSVGRLKDASGDE